MVGASGSGKTLLADGAGPVRAQRARARAHLVRPAVPWTRQLAAAEREARHCPCAVGGKPRSLGMVGAPSGKYRGDAVRPIAPMPPAAAPGAGELFARYGLAEEVARLYPTSSPAAWPGACFCVALMDAAHHRRRAHARPRSVAGPGGARQFPRITPTRPAAASCSSPTTSSWRSPWPIASPSSATARWWRDLGRRLRLADTLGHPLPRSGTPLPEHGFIVPPKRSRYVRR